MSRPTGIPPGLVRMFPRDVVAVAREIRGLDELFREARRLGIELPNALEAAICKRRREYLAGRIAARLALGEMLGGRASRGGLDADGDDVPLWPEGVVGSISHGAGTGFAAVAPANRYAGLGVDVERVVSARQAARLGPRVLTERELELRRGGNDGLTEEEMFTLAFSAKESAYKALFPVHRRVLGFPDVELERREGLQGTERVGNLRLRATIDRDAGAVATLAGWYAVTCDSDGPNGAATRRMWTVVLSDPTAGGKLRPGETAGAYPSGAYGTGPGKGSALARVN